MRFPDGRTTVGSIYISRSPPTTSGAREVSRTVHPAAERGCLAAWPAGRVHAKRRTAERRIRLRSTNLSSELHRIMSPFLHASEG
jgi:hypothetical protein